LASNTGPPHSSARIAASCANTFPNPSSRMLFPPSKCSAGWSVVEVKLDDLTSEIKKINDVSGYDDMFVNNKGLKIVNSSKDSQVFLYLNFHILLFH
jgi:hypothetical protein